MSESSDCIFCMIVDGRLPSSKVYESEHVYAFLDLNPVHEGHTLIIPKTHCENIFDADPAIGADIIRAMQRVGEALKKVTGCAGVNVLQNNGKAAGQMVFHLHWHVIPRFAGDGLSLWPQKKYASMDAMNEMAEALRKELA